MDVDFWQTVIEGAIRTGVTVLIVALVALIRLSIRTRVEYNAPGKLIEFHQQQGEHEPHIWHNPRLHIEVGCNTTWSYTRINTEKMGWWRWWWQVLKLSMLYKRSQSDPEGLDRQATR